ncbi:nuclear matrix constituent protein 1-like isoform X2 [Apium graveolens]|uniref:nuclear matrix constituent protein 1-like isoform X2 n=1 Tax=Apium graveolens TaxID=4045 RepID=UPI003D7BFD33
MFTPPRKNWAGSTTTPRSGPNPRSSNKGKSVSFLDGPPPPRTLLTENHSTTVAVSSRADTGDVDDWRRFTEAGLLDEASMERKDQIALLEKIEKIKKELFDYQYNMGLLLIEKKEWTSNYEQLREALADTQELLKREQTAHLISLSQVEKREDNLMKALEAEKRCVIDLEKALQEVRAENEQMKQSFEAKMVDTDALQCGLKEKSLDVDKKLHVADAKFAEVNRKSLELERKLQEVEARDSALRRERISLIAEREAHEATNAKHKKDLQDWERKLQEGEEILCERRRICIEREEKVNEIERNFNLKEKDIKKAQEDIDLRNLALKKDEDDIKHRLEKLTAEEQIVGALRSGLVQKEEELLARTEKLTARERVEIQKLLDEHRAVLDVRMKEFEAEMDGKRKSLYEEMRGKMDALHDKEVEITHREEKLNKLEQSLLYNSERLNKRERDIEAKIKILNEKEEVLKSDEKRLDMEKKQICVDKDSLQTLKEEIEKARVAISQREIQIQEEIQKLKISEEEREEHLHLQLKLQEEIEKCRHERDLLIMESENLKEDKKKFEEKWEALDERTTALDKEFRELGEEKDKFKKMLLSEEDRFKKERLAMEERVKVESESLRTEKENFATAMKHEQAHLSEKYEAKHNQILLDFELRKKNLEDDIQKRRDELETRLHDRESAFEGEKEKEYSDINFLKEVVRKDMEEVRSEKLGIEKVKQEIALNKKQLEEHQLEMQKDIDDLDALNKKVKPQREQLMKERDRLLAFVDRLKSCNHCGEFTREYELSDLQRLETEYEIPPLSRSGYGRLYKFQDGTDFRSSNSAGHVSWIKKCTSSLFKYSPNKTAQYLKSHSVMLPNVDEKDEGPSASNVESRGLSNAEHEAEASFGIVNVSRDVHLVTSINNREVDQGNDVCTDEFSNINTTTPEAPEDFQQSELKSGRPRSGRKPKVGIHRTRSVKAVVEDAAVILGRTSAGKLGDSDLQEPDGVNEASPGDSSRGEKAVGTTPRKRQRAQTSKVTVSQGAGDYSEEGSESVSEAGRRKRRQMVGSSVQTPGERRYNLRRNKNVGAAASERVSVDTEKMQSKVNVDKAEAVENLKDAPTPSPVIASDKSNQTPLVKVTANKSLQVPDISTERGVEQKTVKTPDKSIETAIAENIEFSEEVIGMSSECRYVGAERGSTLHEDGDNASEDLNNVEDVDDESEHPGKVSIHKKLWTFFTT